MSAQREEKVWEMPAAELGPTSSVPMKVAEGIRPLGKVTVSMDAFDEQPVVVGDRVWLRAHDYSASVVGVVKRVLVEVELDDETAQSFDPVVPGEPLRVAAVRAAK